MSSRASTIGSVTPKSAKVRASRSSSPESTSVRGRAGPVLVAERVGQLQEGLLQGLADRLHPEDRAARAHNAGHQIAHRLVGQHGDAHCPAADPVGDPLLVEQGGRARQVGDGEVDDALVLEAGQRALVAQAPGADDAHDVDHAVDRKSVV